MCTLGPSLRILEFFSLMSPCLFRYSGTKHTCAFTNNTVCLADHECGFQVFYTEARNGRPLGAASAREVPLSLDMLTTVSRGSASSIQKHFLCCFVFLTVLNHKQSRYRPGCMGHISTAFIVIIISIDVSRM